MYGALGKSTVEFPLELTRSLEDIQLLASLDFTAIVLFVEGISIVVRGVPRGAHHPIREFSEVADFWCIDQVLSRNGACEFDSPPFLPNQEIISADDINARAGEST